MKMFNKFKKLTALLLLLAAVSASLIPTALAAVWNHDDIYGFPEVNPTTITQKAAKRFQPSLWVEHGCVPFPAVDKFGNTSGGLEPTGSHNEGCSQSIGQVYTRSTWYNGYWAIMYSWYFPKDEPSSGLGHRHDWESIVVWIDNPAVDNPKVLSISYSGHGDYDHEAPNGTNMSGSHPKIKYTSRWPENHRLFTTGVVGGTQPLIGWDDLTGAARNALTTTSFGSGNVPFKDSNFSNNLGEAWFK